MTRQRVSEAQWQRVVTDAFEGVLSIGFGIADFS